MKKITLLLFLALAMASCKKEPGVGGDASIKGQVWARDFNSNFTAFIGEYPAEDVYVYLAYGNKDGYDKRIKTDYNGYFHFDYLYKGDYKVYVYSLDSTLTDLNNQVAVVNNVTIQERKEEVDLKRITIYN